MGGAEDQSLQTQSPKTHACLALAAQVVVRSYPLGGGGKTEFSAAAVLDQGGLACFAAIHDTASQQHRLVTWPVHTSSKAQAATVQIADIPQSVPLPSRPHSLHALQQGTGVVLADGQVGISTAGSLQLCMAAPATPAPPRLHAACSSDNTLYSLHQASAGEAASLYAYSMSGSQLFPSQPVAVPCPSRTASAQAVHATSTYTLISWSTGALTVVRGPSLAAHLALPPCLGISSPAAAPSIAPTPSKKPGSKRKAGTEEAYQDSSAAALVAAATLDGTQLLVARLHPTQVDTPAHLQYAIMDAQFGCTLSSGIVPLDGPAAASITATALAASQAAHPKVQLVSPSGPLQGQLLLLVLGSVFALSVSAPPANLLALVGKLAVGGTLPAAPVGSPAPSTRTLAPGPDPSSLHKLVTQITADGGRGLLEAGETELVLLPVPGPTEAPSAAGGEAQLEQWVAALQAAQAADRAAPVGVLKGVADAVLSALQPPPATPAGKPAEAPLVSPSVALTVLAPLTVSGLAVAGQWQLLERVLGVLPSRALSGCQGLLLVLAQAQQYALLPQACHRLDEVAPEGLVSALQVSRTSSLGGGMLECFLYMAMFMMLVNEHVGCLPVI